MNIKVIYFGMFLKFILLIPGMKFCILAEKISLFDSNFKLCLSFEVDTVKSQVEFCMAYHERFLKVTSQCRNKRTIPLFRP
jgi:hypothetical protein